MTTPTLEEKVEQYEQFLHNINMMLIASNTEVIQKLIDKAFCNLNKFYTSQETEKLRLDKRLAGREKPNLDEVEFRTPHLKED